jgi:hypothetical protein
MVGCSLYQHNTVYLPDNRKTIKPDRRVGGLIGGEKYVVNNILFKFAMDVNRVFQCNDELAAKVECLLAHFSSRSTELINVLLMFNHMHAFRAQP